MAQKSNRSTRKRASSSSDEAFSKAIASLDKAVRAMHRGEHDKAVEMFKSLGETYPEERELNDRARSYIAVCEKALAGTKRPKTFEEILNQGVIFHNAGDVSQALKFYSKALELEPKNGNVHYYIAAAHAVDGDAGNSARHLELAIKADRTNRILAKTDKDFDAIRGDEMISGLISSSDVA